MTMAPLVLFGGTFDPVHNGHLNVAADVGRALNVPEVRLLPAADPPHRRPPGASAEHRLAMLRLGVDGWPGLVVDAREIARGGRSYTFDTLSELRREEPRRSLAWIVGADAFAGLPTWHRWRELLDLAHFVVVGRPGVVLADPLDSELGEQWRVRRAPDGALPDTPAGAIVSVETAPHDIAATAIREQLARGAVGIESVRGLLPPSVLAYIERHRLYVPNPDAS